VNTNWLCIQARQHFEMMVNTNWLCIQARQHFEMMVNTNWLCIQARQHFEMMVKTNWLCIQATQHFEMMVKTKAWRFITFHGLVYSKLSMMVSQNTQSAYSLYLNSYVTAQIYLQRYTIRLFYFFSLVQDMNGNNKYKPIQTNAVRCIKTLVTVWPKWVKETNI
jgi:hypothetical protein